MKDTTKDHDKDISVSVYYLNNNLGRLVLCSQNKVVISSYFERGLFGPNQEGWIYKAKIKRYVEFLNSYFVDLGNDIGFFPSKNEQYNVGDYVLLKVKRNSISTKKLLLTTQVSLREKFLIVRLIKGPTQLCVSRKISKGVINLRQIRRLLPSQGYHVIMRSSSRLATTSQLLHNFRLLQVFLKWIDHVYQNSDRPRLIYRKSNYLQEFLSQNNCKNIYSNNLRRVKKEFEYFPQDKLRYHTVNLNNSQLINSMINTFKRSVTLPNGISLNFDKTEMGWMIDINSGTKIVQNTEKDIDVNYFINRDATEVIVEQLHLRNMYGIIIIDYINMNQKYLRLLITDYLRDLTLQDRNLIRIHNMNSESILILIRDSKNVVQNYTPEENKFWLMYFDLLSKTPKNTKQSWKTMSLNIQNMDLLNFMLRYNLFQYLDPLINVTFGWSTNDKEDYAINIKSN